MHLRCCARLVMLQLSPCLQVWICNLDEASISSLERALADHFLTLNSIQPRIHEEGVWLTEEQLQLLREVSPVAAPPGY